MKELIGILVPLGCGCLLPIMVVWFSVRRRMNETNKRTEIVLAAIEKNPEMDIEEWMKKISPKQKLLKEKLLSKLLKGTLCALLGLGLVGFGAWLSYAGRGGTDNPVMAICAGLILLAIGIAFLVNYGVGKKMLAKELEAEEQQLASQG
jgi:hypothetical protein